jgi:hypothetical protein
VPFTETTAARLIEVGEALIEALRDHIAAAAVRDAANAEALWEAGEQVVQAAALFDDAHFDHVELPAPVGDFNELDDGEGTDAEVEHDDAIALSIEAVAGVTMLTRQDFVVTDPDALLAVAREAGARARGESAEDFEVSVGHALYELIHVGAPRRVG